MQDCSNSSALAMELLQSCAKPSKWLVPFGAGSEVVVSRPGWCSGDIYSVEWLASTAKLFDYKLHTCDTFEVNGDPFIYLWVYTGDTIGPLHVHVVGNYSCWPQMAQRVIRLTSNGDMEYCTPRTQKTVFGYNFKACSHYCRCKNCVNYIVIQLPVTAATMSGNLGVCEIISN